MVPAILAEQRLHCYLSLRLKAQSQVKSTWWQKALLAVGSICVGLLLAEGLVRLMHLAPRVERIAPGMEETPYRLCDNPILGYVYKENFRGHGSKELPVTYINAMGFADREHEISKPEGCRRIIVLGDSVAARGMPQALEGMLKARNVEVFNFAVNGYCTRAEVELLKERGLQLKADLVVVVFVHNDYLNINADLGWAADKLPAPVKAAFVHSHLFRILSLRLNWYDLGRRMGINDLAGEWVGFLPNEAQKVERIKNTEAPGRRLLKDHLIALGNDNVAQGLRLLKTLSLQHGFQVVIALWPDFENNEIRDYETAEPGKSWVPDEHQRLHIEELAAAEGLACFRFSHFFREDGRLALQEGRLQGKTFEAYYTTDGMHPTPTGNATAAAALMKFVDDHPGLLGGSPK